MEWIAGFSPPPRGKHSMLPIVTIIKLNLIVVAVTDDEAAPQFWLPPDDFVPKAGYALNASDIILCAENGLIIFNFKLGTERRVNFESRPYNFLCRSDHSRIYCYTPVELAAWDVPALICIGNFKHWEKRDSGDYLVEEQAARAEAMKDNLVPLGCYVGPDSGMIEQSDGRLAVLAFSVEKFKALMANPFAKVALPVMGTFFIDPTTWQIELLPTLEPIPHTSSSPASTKTISSTEKVARKRRALATDKAAREFVEQRTRILWPVEGTSADDISCALDRLANRVKSSGFDSLRVGSKLDIVFKLGERELREDKFSAELVAADARQVVPALRDLVTAYLDREETTEGEYPQSEFAGDIYTAPFGYLLKALVLIDNSSIDVYRRYLLSRDASHESFTCRHITPAILKKHGIKTVEDLQFSVFAMLNGSKSGWSDWKQCGVLRAAAKLVSGEEFVEMLQTELKAQSDAELGDADDYDVFIEPIVDDLSKDNDWDRAAQKALSRAVAKSRAAAKRRQRPL
jgi:hypothetical protein